jgi:hypothetical protein
VLKRDERTVVSDGNFIADANAFFGIEVTPTVHADVLADVKIMPADDVHMRPDKNIITACPSKRLEQNPTQTIPQMTREEIEDSPQKGTK